MKKVILVLLTLFFSIALVIGGYILFASRNLQKYEVEEGISCPYSWQELWSGTYRLEIDTTAYPDYSWGVECYPKNVIAVTEVSGKSGTAVFSILSLNMGQTYVQVYCEQTDPYAVRVFEIGMQISVSEDREITVEETEQKEYAGISEVGQDGDYPIQWWADPSGVINLLIEEGNGTDWTAVDYDSDSIDVDGPFYRQSSCGFEIQGKKAGTFPLTIYDGSAKGIRLEIKVTEELAAAITTVSVDAYTPDRSEEHMALETAVGGVVVLPPQAAVTEYSVNSKSGSISFLMDGEKWYWQISTDKEAEELIGDIVGNASETKITSILGVTLNAYRFKDGVVVTWNDGNRTMVLYGESEATVADAQFVAGQIVGANNG